MLKSLLIWCILSTFEVEKKKKNKTFAMFCLCSAYIYM